MPSLCSCLRTGTAAGGGCAFTGRPGARQVRVQRAGAGRLGDPHAALLSHPGERQPGAPTTLIARALKTAAAASLCPVLLCSGGASTGWPSWQKCSCIWYLPALTMQVVRSKLCTPVQDITEMGGGELILSPSTAARCHTPSTSAAPPFQPRSQSQVLLACIMPHPRMFCCLLAPA